MAAVALHTEAELIEAESFALAMDEQRKSIRAKRARQRYAEKKARGLLEPRPPRPPGYEPQKRRAKFDAEDYAEEWKWLTHMGVAAERIIARSNPSRDWFFDHVRLLVTDAICTCGEHFNPAETRMLSKCNKACGLDNGNRRRVERLWLL